MLPLHEIHKEFPSVKTVLVGDPKVGKTTLLRKWVFDFFSLTYKPTIGLDYFDKVINVSGNFPVNLSIYEIAGSQNPIPLNVFQNIHDTYKTLDGLGKQIINMDRIYFKNTKIFFIVVSTESHEEERMAQINKWRAEIKQNMEEGDVYKIIIIENQFGTRMNLSWQDLEKTMQKDEYFVALSVKEDKSFPHLENIIKKIVPELLGETPQCPPLSGILKLNEMQATRTLNFVEKMIKRGTTHNVLNPYKVGLLGMGGKIYKYSDIDHSNRSHEIALKVPENVVAFLNTISEIRNNVLDDGVRAFSDVNAKKTLLKLYEKSIKIVSSKPPISRRASTQIFYTKVLPHYIFKSVQPETITLHAKIEQLSNARAKTILGELKIKLLTGNNEEARNALNPYAICFLGGDSYKHEGRKIKLPHHVVLLITKIDEFMRLNNDENAKQILSEVYQDIIQAQVTPNTYRKPTTQEFYDRVLPNFLNEIIGNSLVVAAPAAERLSIQLK